MNGPPKRTSTAIALVALLIFIAIVVILKTDAVDKLPSSSKPSSSLKKTSNEAPEPHQFLSCFSTLAGEEFLGLTRPQRRSTAVEACLSEISDTFCFEAFRDADLPATLALTSCTVAYCPGFSDPIPTACHDPAAPGATAEFLRRVLRQDLGLPDPPAVLLLQWQALQDLPKNEQHLAISQLLENLDTDPNYTAAEHTAFLLPILLASHLE